MSLTGKARQWFGLDNKPKPPAYEKLEQATQFMVLARDLREFVTGPAWPKIREYYLEEAERMQQELNKLCANPSWNEAEIVHLNARRDARESLIREIEQSASKYEEWRDRVAELKAFIEKAEALNRTA